MRIEHNAAKAHLQQPRPIKRGQSVGPLAFFLNATRHEMAAEDFFRRLHLRDQELLAADSDLIRPLLARRIGTWLETAKRRREWCVWGEASWASHFGGLVGSGLVGTVTSVGTWTGRGTRLPAVPQA